MIWLAKSEKVPRGMMDLEPNLHVIDDPFFYVYLATAHSIVFSAEPNVGSSIAAIYRWSICIFERGYFI